MREKWIAARSALRGNRGSGIVMVLVCMLCVTLLGTALLYLSYTGLLIKTTERQSKQNFYSAETAVEEMRAGVQQAVSDSIAAAYKESLVRYTSAEPDQIFRTAFVDALWQWSNEDGALFNKTTRSYDLDVLRGFVSDPTHVHVSADSAVELLGAGADQVFRLRGLQVTYTDAKGYETTITTDISVSMPSFTYILSRLPLTGLPEYAVIARDTLKQEIGNSRLNIDGSAYAHKIVLSGTGSTLTVENGVLVCGDTVQVKDSGPNADTARLLVERTVNLWASRIEVLTDGTVDLRGDTYVADDLDLSGTGASATLSGSYYGFGNSAVKGSESSAILVNGRNANLDLSGLTQLMLTGHSFVSDYNHQAEGSPVTDVLMGESVSTRGNQQAYLIPSAYLTNTQTGKSLGSNPFVWTGNPAVVELNAMGAAAYAGYVTTARSIKPVYIGYPGAVNQKIAYYFINFASEEQANAFFKDYFAAHPAEIKSYLDTYTTLSAMTGTLQTAGYTVVQNADSTYRLEEPVATDSLGPSAAFYQQQFNRLKSALFEPVEIADTDPYRYLVKEDRIRTLASQVTEFQNTDGDVVGVIVQNAGGAEYTIGASADLKIVIATGDVVVGADFDGLIISGGSIDMQHSVSARETEVTPAFFATAPHSYEDPLTHEIKTENVALATFLKDGIVEDQVSSITGTSTAWNLNQLVSYSNWIKN